MKKNVYVSASTEPVKLYQDIIEYAKEMQSIADFLHCDVMDGKFVEKYNFDFNLIKNINSNTIIPLDVHLMTSEPLKDLKKYIEAGANIITVHYEAFENKDNLVEAIKLIKEKKVLAGISLKPETFFKEIKPYCFDIDVVLVMSVEPGASGQKFIANMYNKIKEINEFRQQNQLNFKIEVDGGVNKENAKILRELGVDMFVSGNYIYKANNKELAISDLKGG